MNNWQPIDTAPKDGTSVLLYWDGDISTGYYVDAEDEHGPDRYWWAFETITSTPTHWMPLPPPPEQDKQ